MKKNGAVVTAALFTALLLTPALAVAGYEGATFESFYRTSNAIAWGVGAVMATVAVVFFVLSGGTAGPIEAAIGTWIGNAMGLSGVAATNAGLATLGGGAIAAGGFGMLGGTVVLTAALSFSSAVVFDLLSSKLLA